MPRHAFKANLRGWNQLVGKILETEGVNRMGRVADACNTAADTEDYKVSVEGDRPLRKRDWRVTVITAGAEAIRDNRRNQTLLRNFTLASGK